MGLFDFIKLKLSSFNAVASKGQKIENSDSIIKHLEESEESVLDAKAFRRFTKPSEHNKALSVLSGIVQGLEGDGSISKDEISELLNWCALHAHLQSRNPFSELIPMIKAALKDGVLTDEEREDILWVCRKNYFGRDYYDDVTNSLQVLCGYAHGLLADKELSNKEILALSEWIKANDFLAGHYPFDEINNQLTEVLKDGVNTENEREELILLLSNLIDYDESLNLSKTDFEEIRKKHSTSGICEACQDLIINGHSFCFTGEFDRYDRPYAMAMVEKLGGVNKEKVSSRCQYLVVGNQSSPAWAYSCYGRKIERALQLKKEGKEIHIIKESDFWHAVGK